MLCMLKAKVRCFMVLCFCVLLSKLTSEKDILYCNCNAFQKFPKGINVQIKKEMKNEEIEHTWNKVKVTSKQTGLREGISDGRESNFQKSFDIGYQEGFRNGYMLGKYKAVNISHSRQNSTSVRNHELLEKTARGDCVVCKDSRLSETSETEIVRCQSERFSANEQTLKEVIEDIVI